MRNARILAIVLALLLALPAVAGAESGSYTLKLSDPVVQMVQGGETITQDLTGIALQFGGVVDTDPASPAGALSLVLLAQDEPAASAIVGLEGETLYALVSGISSVVTVPLGELAGILEEQGALPASVGDQIAAAVDVGSLLDKIEFTEGPAEEVQFLNATGNCPRVSAHLTRDQLLEMLGDASDLPEDMSMDVSYFTDEESNIRIEGSLNDVLSSASEGERDLPFVVVAEIVGDGMRGGAWIGNDSAEITANFEGGMDEQFPDHIKFDFVAEAVDLTSEDGESYQIQMQIAPAEADGAVATLVSATVYAVDIPVGGLECSFSATDSAENFSLYVGDAGGENTFSLNYAGTVGATTSGEARDGKVEFAAVSGGESVSGSFNIATDISTDIEGKLPDISSMPQIQYDQITDEQMGQLASEGQEALITAMGKLMSVPAVAAIIAATMQ